MGDTMKSTIIVFYVLIGVIIFGCTDSNAPNPPTQNNYPSHIGQANSFNSMITQVNSF